MVLRAVGAARGEGLLTSSDPLLLAVSGGADSMAMLHALASRARELELGRIDVATVDHGLRSSPEIEGEIETVRNFCEAVDLEHRTLRVQVEQRGARGGLQAAARAARRSALEAERKRVGAALILTAHTSSDQAETVLMRILRGTSPAGLAAIRPRSGVYARPFLGCSRSAMRAHCEAHQVPFHDDPSNSDRRFDRVALRHDLLPVAAALNPGVEAALCRLADLAADDDALLAGLSAELACAVARPGGLDPRQLASAPEALSRRVLIAAWREAGGDGVRTEHRFVQEILAKLGDPASSWRRDLPGGVRVTLARGLLAFDRTPPRA